MKYLLHWLVTSLVALMASPAGAQMGPPSTLTAQQFAATATGQNVVLAIRVSKRARTTLDAELLDHVDGERYRARPESRSRSTWPPRRLS